MLGFVLLFEAVSIVGFVFVFVVASDCGVCVGI